MADIYNTHFYDGKLGDRVTVLQTQLDRAHAVPLIEKLDVFKKLGARVTSEHAIANLFTIIRDAVNNPAANFDPSNGVHAEDLLYLICEKIDVEDTAKVLGDELANMSSGLCAQGRTNRLWQVVMFLYDK